jgi:two-component sensor histidine kinase
MPDGHRGEIIINVKHKNEFIIFEIIDNGIGRNKADEINKQKTTNSLGTKINKSRADLFNEIFDLKIQIKYVDLLDSQGNSKGTRVVIKLNSSIIK